MKIHDTFALEAFVKASQLQSFSKAAVNLGVTPSLVSKKISQLESQLQTVLFNRTTRSISLTEEGQKLLTASEHILEELQNIEESFLDKSTANKHSGLIRISTSETYANARLTKVIADFAKTYSDIKIKLILSNSILNIHDENIDVAVRVYKPKDSNIKSFKLEANKLIFCASPKYISNHSPIKNIKDLQKHNCLYLKQHASVKFLKAGSTIQKIFSDVQIECNSGESINQFCINDFGIGIRSSWDVERYIKKNRLVEIKINDTLVSKSNVYTLFKNTRHTPLRIRLFLDFLKNSISD